MNQDVLIELDGRQAELVDVVRGHAQGLRCTGKIGQALPYERLLESGHFRQQRLTDELMSRGLAPDSHSANRWVTEAIDWLEAARRRN